MLQAKLADRGGEGMGEAAGGGRRQAGTSGGAKETFNVLFSYSFSPVSFAFASKSFHTLSGYTYIYMYSIVYSI